MVWRPKKKKSLLYTNIRSVVNKRDALSSVVDMCSADIVVLTETWLYSKIIDREILECEGAYYFYRHDRDVRSGSGVLIAARDSLISSAIQLASLLELVCARIGFQQKKLYSLLCLQSTFLT